MDLWKTTTRRGLTTTASTITPREPPVVYRVPAMPLSNMTCPVTKSLEKPFRRPFIGSSPTVVTIPFSPSARAPRATPGNLGADTRSPYGSMNFDGGDGSSDMGGASYGDTLKFVTLAGTPEWVTGLSGWSDNEANTIPYAMEWVTSTEVDAEMGHVATLPITVQDQGADRDANSTLDPGTGRHWMVP